MANITSAPNKRLQDVRKNIESLKRQIERYLDAPLPLNQALDRMNRAFGEEIEICAEDFAYREGSGLQNYKAGHEEVAEALLNEILRSKFEKEIKAWYDAYELGIFDSDDTKRLVTQLQADVFALEVEEERIVTKLESSGQEVSRRRDANPHAILAAAE